VRIATLFLLIAVGVLLVACEEPDQSNLTAPGVRSLIGTTTGNVAYLPADAPPDPKAPPDGWHMDVDVALLGELDNGTPSLRFSMQMVAQPGPAMEVWLADDTHTIARWSAGSARRYDGIVCFQLTLDEGGEALPMQADKTYYATVAFRQPEGDVVVARKIRVSGRLPTRKGQQPPGQGAIVFSEALACPKGG
jgi:hypothetical protein